MVAARNEARKRPIYPYAAKKLNILYYLKKNITTELMEKSIKAILVNLLTFKEKCLPKMMLRSMIKVYNRVSLPVKFREKRTNVHKKTMMRLENSFLGLILSCKSPKKK